tara:strand:- start:168 stop:452 length:285 start_codon:yes stop_codon:yes gene_type:complete
MNNEIGRMEDIKNEMNELTHEELKKYAEILLDDLEFYRSIFLTHRNSAVFNLQVKTINGKNVWVDRTRDSYEYIIKLDKDKEVEEWLTPTKASR